MSGHKRQRERPSASGRGPAAPHDRFLALTEERALREWQRYEGTPQRDLFRQLRERFLERHAARSGWALDVGSGPGRFSPLVGGERSRRVALDLSANMLRIGSQLASFASPPRSIERVRGDALRPPFAPGRFAEVVALGNPLGFEGRHGVQLLDQLEALVAPGGLLIVEIAPGPGEHAVYLRRLPPGAVGRLLASPPALVAARIVRERFAREPRRHRELGFRRWTVAVLAERWAALGWKQLETLSLAPALGADPERIAAVASTPRAWERLLQLEEELGRDPARWPGAASVLLAARRPEERPSLTPER
jgi:hypothetical protein